MSQPTEKILLTGATGFLGSHLLKSLVQHDKACIVLKRSTSDTGRIAGLLKKVDFYDSDKVTFEEIFKTHSVDWIIHCATNYGRRGENLSEILEANLQFPLKLLQSASRCGLKGFINVDTALKSSTNAYSLSKKQFLEWLTTFSRTLKTFNLRFEQFYGPNDSDSKFTTRVIQNLAKSVDKMDFTLGEQKREFLYIDDAIQAILTVLQQSAHFGKGLHEFEVGSGQSVSIREFVQLVKEISQNQNTQLNFGAIPYSENELMNSQMDISRLVSLGWTPKVGLAEGIQKTIQLSEGHHG